MMADSVTHKHARSADTPGLVAQSECNGPKRARSAQQSESDGASSSPTTASSNSADDEIYMEPRFICDLVLRIVNPTQPKVLLAYVHRFQLVRFSAWFTKALGQSALDRVTDEAGRAVLTIESSDASEWKHPFASRADVVGFLEFAYSCPRVFTHDEAKSPTILSLLRALAYFECGTLAAVVAVVRNTPSNGLMHLDIRQAFLLATKYNWPWLTESTAGRLINSAECERLLETDSVVASACAPALMRTIQALRTESANRATADSSQLKLSTRKIDDVRALLQTFVASYRYDIDPRLCAKRANDEKSCSCERCDEEHEAQIDGDPSAFGTGAIDTLRQIKERIDRA